jgi:uncharacterized protein YggU (UPF0235/DUF167 family)
VDAEKRDFKLHDGRSGAALTIRVTPSAIKDEVSAIQEDGTIKIRLVAAVPVEDINRALLKFLSGLLDVRLSQLEIVVGDNGLDKLVTITGIDAHEVEQRILKEVAKPEN